MAFYVYIVASRRNGTVYIGSTDDLIRRVYERRTKGAEASPPSTMRERLKEWRRSWKLLLIEECNPTWEDLCESLSP